MMKKENVSFNQDRPTNVSQILFSNVPQNQFYNCYSKWTHKHYSKLVSQVLLKISFTSGTKLKNFTCKDCTIKTLNKTKQTRVKKMLANLKFYYLFKFICVFPTNCLYHFQFFLKIMKIQRLVFLWGQSSINFFKAILKVMVDLLTFNFKTMGTKHYFALNY